VNSSMKTMESVKVYVTSNSFVGLYPDGQMQVPAGTNPSGELHMHYLLGAGINKLYFRYGFTQCLRVVMSCLGGP
jgi:hypothetical protein